MTLRARKMLNFMGVDRAIVYTLIGRGWGVFSGIATLFLVVRYFTPDEQGYYYTFASVLAMQIFFELGMSYVVMQFASHEMANLTWSNTGLISGESNSKSRLYSLISLVTKWYSVISILILVLILPAGWLFFSANHPNTGVQWQSAWIWLCLATAINIFTMPLLALFEGCGLIAEIAQLRMHQNIIGSIMAWTVLISGGGLLAMPAMSTGLALTVLIWLWKSKRNFLKDYFDYKVIGEGIKWKAEIWPFQWKIALSWLSGYFIFQLFTPVLFSYQGALEAGKMGMSITIANALMSIAMAWMNTKVPGFGTLIAKGNYLALDRIFGLTLSRSLGVLVVGGGGLCVLNYIVHITHIQFADRILEPIPFTLLMLATTLNYIAYAQAAYLRAHKEEPFLLISLISAALIGILTFVCGARYGATGMMASYLAVCIFVGFAWGSVIFFSKRSKWQKAAQIKHF